MRMLFLASPAKRQLRHWPASLVAMLGLCVLCVSCMTQSKIPNKRDPIYDEVMRLATRWEQCFKEQQSIQMAEAEEELCSKIRGDFQKFTDGLASSENLTRICSAGTLGFSKDPRAIPYLIASLNDPLEEVRTNALFSLAFMKDPSTPVAQIVPLTYDSQDRVRHNAMHAIAQLVTAGDDRGARSAILRGLDDRHPGVRNEAIRALIAIRDKSTAQAIITKGLKDDYHKARINAATALGILAVTDAIEPLITSLGDTNMHVREAAGVSLRHITAMDMPDDMTKWLEWWDRNKSRFVSSSAPPTTTETAQPLVPVTPPEETVVPPGETVVPPAETTAPPTEPVTPPTETTPPPTEQPVVPPVDEAARAAAEEERLHRTRCDIALFHLTMLGKAADKFLADNGRLPAALQELVTKPEDAKSWPEEGYITSVPEDPWGNQYVYRITSAENKTYDLFCTGEDGAEGGEGRAGDIKR